jgi:hypothetical protein
MLLPDNRNDNEQCLSLAQPRIVTDRLTVDPSRIDLRQVPQSEAHSARQPGQKSEVYGRVKRQKPAHRLGRVPSAAVLSALIVAGCGGASPTTPVVKIQRPKLPIWCPGKIRVPTTLSEPDRRTKGAFDTRTLLGRTETNAATVVRAHGCVWRVVERNGHGLTTTLDARGDRVDAAIARGVVVKVGVY